MPKFIWAGTNTANKGGLSSKAYTIRRFRNKVITKHGSIEIKGGGSCKKIFWKGKHPIINEIFFMCAQEALEFTIDLALSKLSKGYEELPGRVRIRKAT